MNYSKKLLSLVMGLIIGISVLVMIPNSVNTAPVDKSKLSKAELQAYLASEAFDAINNQRIAKGLKPYTWDKDLAVIANKRASELAVLFSHTRPNGKDFSTAYTDKKYFSFAIGETLAKGFDNGKDAVSTWMSSDFHKDFIVGNDYRHCSIGVFIAADGSIYYAAEYSNK